MKVKTIGKVSQNTFSNGIVRIEIMGFFFFKSSSYFDVGKDFIKHFSVETVMQPPEHFN